jgi:hypothetical protein
MDVWEIPQSSRSRLDRGVLMDVGPTRARGETGDSLGHTTPGYRRRRSKRRSDTTSARVRGTGRLATSPIGKKIGRANRGTWKTRCRGRPADATSTVHNVEAVGRRLMSDRDQEPVRGQAVKHSTPEKTRRSSWPWKSHGKMSLLPVVALLPLTFVPTRVGIVLKS